MTLFEAQTGGASDRLNWQHRGEFDQTFSKKLNAPGFARGGGGAWADLELTGTLSWPPRVGRLQNVGKLVPSHVKLNNANLQYGRRSAVALTQSCRLCLGLILS